MYPFRMQSLYRLAFSTIMGQMCYLRMGQGCTGGPGTYTQLKDIVTSDIPAPDAEPVLGATNPGHVVFDHFVEKPDSEDI